MTSSRRCLPNMKWNRLGSRSISWVVHQNFKSLVNLPREWRFPWTYSCYRRSRECRELFRRWQCSWGILSCQLMVRLSWLPHSLRLLTTCSIRECPMIGCMIQLVLRFHGCIQVLVPGSPRWIGETHSYQDGLRMLDLGTFGWQVSSIHKDS